MLIDDGLIEGITIEHLINKVAPYNLAGIPKIKQAYELAANLHDGQFRESGEAYITHPLNVAYTLACLYADTDTICAAILHDCVEDTKITIEEIEMLFGNDIAILVDGVTKLNKLNFYNREEARMANMKKIILSLKTDIRIIIIKLADRLHNMRTMEYKKKKDKQRDNGIETLELFAPIADKLGIYRMKTELEDLGLKYAFPEDYHRVRYQVMEEEERSKEFIEEMLCEINNILEQKGISHEVKVRTKNIYGVYKRLRSSARNLSDIHDLLAFKILVDEVDDCYLLLRPIHNAYRPINSKFKDYICNPKTNQYQSIHTTVNGVDGKLVQMQLRTFDMDKVASFGITHNWETYKEEAKNYMQDQVSNSFPFYKSLLELESIFRNDSKSFVEHTLTELLSESIYVMDLEGKDTELPVGATIIDYAYKQGAEIGNHLVGAIVNDEEVDINTCVLKNGDRIGLTIDKSVDAPKVGWALTVKTTQARRLILERRKESITY